MLADNCVLRNWRLRHHRGIHLDLQLDVCRLPLSRKSPGFRPAETTENLSLLHDVEFTGK